ncbi:hypothetical protein [Pseudomonas sp. MWU12-2037]|uniref:hypothetical protein n=1 Tax=Pseudomonas sp. MWU12-2037 TaxID=2928690 RepID=UPI00200FC6AC|nr:hypothetical protein [Pseudomonas sp. MWU12-2037]
MPQEPIDPILAELIRTHHQSTQTPHLFFRAWKQAVQLAGITYFGDGSRSGFQDAQSKWDLCPNMPLIQRAIGVMSHGEKVFLAALVSFYNAEDGGRLLQAVDVHGLADLGVLDAKRRALIAHLILNYSGW